MSLHQDPTFFPTLFQKLRQASPARRQQAQQQQGGGSRAAATTAAAAAVGGEGEPPAASEEWRDLVAFLQVDLGVFSGVV